MSVRDTSIDPKLLQSAREEFKEKGFLKADLKSICDSAGVTTGAVYKRYKGKEELFGAVVEGVVKALDDFKILIDKSAGTVFENFSHDYVIKMIYAYEHFYKETYRRGIAKAKVGREEFHILLTSFWSSICEPFVHDMPEKEMEEHCRVMCRFFDWASVIKMPP